VCGGASLRREFAGRILTLVCTQNFGRQLRTQESGFSDIELTCALAATKKQLKG
jgi:hypothetical protein